MGLIEQLSKQVLCIFTCAHTCPHTVAEEALVLLFQVIIKSLRSDTTKAVKIPNVLSPWEIHYFHSILTSCEIFPHLYKIISLKHIQYFKTTANICKMIVNTITFSVNNYENVKMCNCTNDSHREAQSWENLFLVKTAIP